MRVNIDPQKWGSCAWQFLDYCAQACDEASASQYREFIELLPSVLPCEQCREHAGAYIASHPVDTRDLPQWLQRFKAAVSARKSLEVPRSAKCCGGRISYGARVCMLIVFVILLAAAFAILLVALTKLTKAG